MEAGVVEVAEVAVEVVVVVEVVRVVDVGIRGESGREVGVVVRVGAK